MSQKIWFYMDKRQLDEMSASFFSAAYYSGYGNAVGPFPTCPEAVEAARKISAPREGRELVIFPAEIGGTGATVTFPPYEPAVELAEKAISQ